MRFAIALWTSRLLALRFNPFLDATRNKNRNKTVFNETYENPKRCPHRKQQSLCVPVEVHGSKQMGQL